MNNRWISVDKELPECEWGMPGHSREYSKYVLILKEGQDIFNDRWEKAYFENSGIWWDMNNVQIKENITHYMNIQPPEDE